MHIEETLIIGLDFALQEQTQLLMQCIGKMKELMEEDEEDNLDTIIVPVMKPYPFSTSASLEHLTFNYNFCKARRVVGNDFGHLKAGFRRIGKGLDNHQKFKTNIIMCCCVLHKFLNHHNCGINEDWKTKQKPSLQQPESNKTSVDQSVPAENIRKAIKL